MSLEFLSLETMQEIARQYGYWSVFLGIMLENTGIPLPGETIVVVGGFLAGSGELNYWLVLGCAIAGAVLGDNFGYWIGFYGGWPLLLRMSRFFRIPESQLIDLRNRFSHNAARAVFFGRFVALLRIFAGPMAGIVQMPYLRFLLANTAGATLWAIVTVTATYFAGRVFPLEQVAAWMGQLGLVVLVGVVFWLAGLPVLKYLKRKWTAIAEPL
jgi:membrane protein DedA with SNARE-associated domain